MEPGILEKKIAKLPDEMKQEVEHYVDVLLQKLENPLPLIENSDEENYRGYGSLKGKMWIADDFDEPLDDEKIDRVFGSLKGFVTHISDDFDEPLEDFKDYM